MNNSLLLLSALCLITLGFVAPSASAEEMTAGEALTENTAEMTVDSENAFDTEIDCAKEAMSGEEISAEQAEACASQNDMTPAEDAHDATVDAVEEINE